jgi:hypothetical protein
MNRAKVISAVYYQVKPMIPRRIQIWLRRNVAVRQKRLYETVWPIDENCSKAPEAWSGWPEEKRFALVLTHDVDTAKGQAKCYELIELEKRLGFRSSFYFVPKRYEVSSELRNDLVRNGFEVGVHGLYHDGKLYTSRHMFQERAKEINQYLHEWPSVGFRSPSMHHNLDWIHDLNIEYDASTFDTDPFEPQPDGVGTIFPFWVDGNSKQKGYMELPYTLSQDFTLFVLMQEGNIDIWIRKLDWIVKQGGMALLNTHPDYMNFDGRLLDIEEYPVRLYAEFLRYVKDKYEGQYWHALPREMARFWTKGYQTR